MEEQHKDYQEKSVEVIKRIQDQPSKLLEKEGLFSFYNLNYTIIKKKKEEKILRNINGYCQRGKLLAIMGSSGAGKTTLLDVLAARNKVGQISGEVLINGKPLPENFRQISGYVMQDDVLIPTLTVRETVSYIMDLRIPSSQMNQEQKEAKLIHLLKILNLYKIRDSQVGSPLKRGISGGERKRLSIAVEMVTSPSILFLDEPTTNLDSSHALRVMKALKNICRASHCTVICTIHQPRSNIFQMFDYLLLLNEGRTVFFGETLNSVNYFSRLGYIFPEFSNPADYLMDIIKDPSEKSDPNSTSLTEIKSSENLETSHWKVFENSKSNQVLIQSLQEIPHNDSQNVILKKKRHQIIDSYPISHLKQIYILTKRTWFATTRDSSVMLVRTGAALGIGLLVGSLFFQQKDDLTSVENRIHTMLFLMCVFSLFCVPAIGKLIEDRHLFTRENANGLYSTSSYAIAVFLVEFPVLLMTAVVYGCLAYWMVGLEPNIFSFLFFLLIIFLVIHVGFAISQALAALFQTTNVAIACYMLLLVYSLLVGGFIVPPHSLPVYLRWMVYTSYYFYGFESLCVNEFENRSYADVVLADLGFNRDTKFRDVSCLCGLFIFYRLLAYIFLRYLHKEQR